MFLALTAYGSLAACCPVVRVLCFCVRVFSSIRAAWQEDERLGLGEEGTSYWDIHIKEDIRHGQWMLQDVALPILKQYEGRAWQVLMGYDQQKNMSERALKSIVESICELENY